VPKIFAKEIRVEERVLVTKQDGIADVRLNRPDKLNAVDPGMFTALVDTALELAADRSLRAIVLSGEGRAFCSGLDIPAVMAGLGGERRKEASDEARVFTENQESPANAAQRSAWVWQEIPIPVIAAIHGVAYGAGLQIAMGADVRYVAPDARLSVRELHWGLVPDVALTQTMRHVVGLDVAKELTFTARVVSGSEAKELRLATHVSEDPHAAAMALAREIAGRSPDAVRAAKRLLNGAAQEDVAGGLALEASIQKQLIGGANQQEAVKANLEKREPKFSDPD